MRPPFPQRVRRQRRMLKVVAMVVGFAALVMLSLWCGSWSAGFVD